MRHFSFFIIIVFSSFALVGCGLNDFERIEKIAVSSDADFLGKIVKVDKEKEMILVEVLIPDYEISVEVFIDEETSIFDSSGKKLNFHELKRKDLVEVWAGVQLGSYTQGIKYSYTQIFY